MKLWRQKKVKGYSRVAYYLLREPELPMCKLTSLTLMGVTHTYAVRRIASQLQNTTVQMQLMTLQCDMAAPSHVLNWNWIPNGKQQQSLRDVCILQSCNSEIVWRMMQNRKGREAYKWSSYIHIQIVCYRIFWLNIEYFIKCISYDCFPHFISVCSHFLYISAWWGAVLLQVISRQWLPEKQLKVRPCRN